jgi:hypothetical protein
MLLLWWCPFKIQKEKWPGLQFTRTDYLSLLLTTLRIRWTIPLISVSMAIDILLKKEELNMRLLSVSRQLISVEQISIFLYTYTGCKGTIIQVAFSLFQFVQIKTHLRFLSKANQNYYFFTRPEPASPRDWSLQEDKTLVAHHQACPRVHRPNIQPSACRTTTPTLLSRAHWPLLVPDPEDESAQASARYWICSEASGRGAQTTSKGGQNNVTNIIILAVTKCKYVAKQFFLHLL